MHPANGYQFEIFTAPLVLISFSFLFFSFLYQSTRVQYNPHTASKPPRTLRYHPNTHSCHRYQRQICQAGQTRSRPAPTWCKPMRHACKLGVIRHPKTSQGTHNTLRISWNSCAPVDFQEMTMRGTLKPGLPSRDIVKMEMSLNGIRGTIDFFFIFFFRFFFFFSFLLSSFSISSPFSFSFIFHFFLSFFLFLFLFFFLRYLFIC